VSDRSRNSGQLSRDNVLEVFDKTSFERVRYDAPLAYYDDFVGAGAVVIPAAGSAESGVAWTKKIVGAAPPTVAGVADAAGGAIACTLTSTSEKQDAALYCGDQRNFDVTKGLVFEARFKFAVLPSAAAVQTVLGLSDDWIDGPDNASYYLQVGATANGALVYRSKDGVNTVSTSAGVTLTTADWAIVRIDASDVTDVAYYINGDRVNAAGSVAFAATGANAILQPYMSAYKASGTGVGTLYIDYVKIWTRR